MKYFSWILTVPVAIVAVVFSITNREPAALNLWPLGITLEVPLFILVLGSGLVGLILGGMITWLSAGRVRRRARKAEYRASDAEREVQDLQHKLEHETVSHGPASPAGVPARASTLPAGQR